MKPTDIRIDQVSFGYEDFRYRTPIKFGGVALDRATILNVQSTVRTVAVIAVLALVGVGVVLGRGPAPIAAVLQARASGSLGGSDLARPPWFHMSLLDDSIKCCH